METIVRPQALDHWDRMGMRPSLEALRSESGEAMVLRTKPFAFERATRSARVAPPD
jgi:haloalkane dehalogenase